MPTIILHLMNEDPVVGELDAVPSANDTVIVVKNPRRKDGKDVHYLDPSVSSVVWPLGRVAFIEVLPLGEEEEIITHVRE